jgi:hypothetical protein
MSAPCRPSTRKPRSFLRFFATLLSLILATGAQAAVMQCRDDAGQTHFLQFGCPPDTTPMAPDGNPADRLSVVVTAPLSAEEERALVQLERRLAKDRQQRAQVRARTARARAAEAADAGRRCREATRQLEQLAETRRKGYRATAEARLEAEEARWRSARKSSC